MNKTTLMLNVGIAIMALVMISLGFLVGDVDAAPLGDKLGCSHSVAAMPSALILGLRKRVNVSPAGQERAESPQTLSSLMEPDSQTLLATSVTTASDEDPSFKTVILKRLASLWRAVINRAQNPRSALSSFWKWIKEQVIALWTLPGREKWRENKLKELARQRKVLESRIREAETLGQHTRLHRPQDVYSEGGRGTPVGQDYQSALDSVRAWSAPPINPTSPKPEFLRDSNDEGDASAEVWAVVVVESAAPEGPLPAPSPTAATLPRLRLHRTSFGGCTD